MDAAYSDSSFEQEVIEDVPGMEVRDITGDYAVSTRRLDDGKGAIRKYITQLFHRVQDESVAFGIPPRNELISESTNYTLDIAVSIHEFTLNELNRMLEAA